MLYIICLLILVLTFFYVKKILKINSIPRRWIYYIIIYNCFIKFFQGYLNAPSFLNYVTDFMLVIILFYFFVTSRNSMRAKVPKVLKIILCIYILITLVSYCINIYNPLLYLWGFRNNVRFIIFAMMCSVYIEKDDINNILNMLFGYFLINIIAVTYEFFFAGLTFRTGDVISGLYSMKTTQGGNDSLNWIMCIICTYSITQYINKNKKLMYLCICFLGSLYMAALSELKVFFVEIIVISITSILLNKKSLKSIILIILGISILPISINLLYKYFPQYTGFFNIENIKSVFIVEEGYNGLGSMSRSNAISYIFDNFLTNWSARIFGIGLGNADYSSFSFLTSSFYLNNSHTAYQWFYGPFILIENGIMGLFVYFIMFMNFIRESLKLKITDKNLIAIKNFNIIISILAIIMLFYDQSLKTETSGYLIYLILSIPYVIKRYVKNNKEV